MICCGNCERPPGTRVVCLSADLLRPGPQATLHSSIVVGPAVKMVAWSWGAVRCVLGIPRSQNVTLFGDDRGNQVK